MTHTYGLRVWDGSGWIPAVDYPVYVKIAPSATPPGAKAATKTTLAVAPTSVYIGSSVTFTATVSPTLAGTVMFQYLSGSSWVNWANVAVSGNTAKLTWAVSRSLSVRAIFTPTNSAAYNTSTSGTVTVTGVAIPTTPVTAGGSSNADMAYRGSGVQRPDYDGNTCYYGYYSSLNGDQRSMVLLGGLSALRGVNPAHIKSATLKFTNAHTYPGNGTSVRVTATTSTAIPGSLTSWGGAYFDMGVPNNGAVSVPIPVSMAQGFASGGANTGFIFSAAVGGTNGYGYLSAASLTLTLNRS